MILRAAVIQVQCKDGGLASIPAQLVDQGLLAIHLRVDQVVVPHVVSKIDLPHAVTHVATGFNLLFCSNKAKAKEFAAELLTHFAGDLAKIQSLEDAKKPEFADLGAFIQDWHDDHDNDFTPTEET